MTGAALWDELLAGFAPVFTTPSFEIFVRMITAWPLCPGRRTVTRIYQIAEPIGEKAHDAYHRFVRQAAWSMPSLWKLMALTLVAALYPKGRIPTDLDDTLFHKTGRNIRGSAWWRDAVRSTGQKVVHAFGLNLVVITLRVTAPWGGEPLGLPITMRLHRKGDPGLLELAEQMSRELLCWFPHREFDLVADGFYASLAGNLPPQIQLTSRMRLDAALYDLPTKPKKHKRGRPRKRGVRLPTPKQMAQSKTGWRRIITEERGKYKERLVLIRKLLWYKVLPHRPVLLVISRDPQGKEKDDFFFTTDLSCTPKTVVERYAGRWSIEDTFKNVKQFLGGQDPQSWKHNGPERAAALSLWLYSVVWLWYLKAYGSKRSWIPSPWYTNKCNPSFADALASLRRILWRERIFYPSDTESLQPEIAETLINILAYAA